VASRRCPTLGCRACSSASISAWCGKYGWALADRDSGPERVGDLTDGLASALSGPLKHEVDEALPLIEATVTQQWRHFGEVHGSRIGPDAPRLIPWLLDGADEHAVATMLARLPEPVRAAYWDQWQPAYAALDRWNASALGLSSEGYAPLPS
jgi:hypothetical protein